MASHIRVSKPTIIFVAVVVTAGSLALTASLYDIYKHPLPYTWIILAALTLFSFVFTIKVPGIPATISVSETFVFISVLLFGTSAATVTVALDALIMSSWRHRKEPLKVLFNATEPALSIWLASSLFFSLLGNPTRDHSFGMSTLLVPLLVLSLSYFLLNSCLTAVAIGLQTGTRVINVWRDHFFWLSLSYLGGASVAALIVQVSRNVNITTLSIILPLLVISYLTFKSSMGRVEDANKHLDQVNKMYMSTIETLAMAVDAKDQVTHGHIRRVQNYALALAKALGMDDPQILKAIEAAALLHDMGKLAIPEYILNKPGKLSPAEFEKMKSHAALGADILSSIEFPYPVVPIVRHHHESWDGSGYPDNLSGADIPVGARILAVVDCFDALTSDRPYRPKLSPEDAVRILRERRGSMYDPLIVDTFVDLHSTLVHQNSLNESPPLDQSYLIQDFAHTDRGRHNHVDMHRLESLVAQETELYVIADKVVNYLREVVPNSLSVFYKAEETSNELVAFAISPDTRPSVKGLRIQLAQQLSGWVGAHLETISNSDAALDLRDLAAQLALKNCLSTPITATGTLFGVITLYRTTNQLFVERDRDIVESVSQVLAVKLAAVKLESISRSDPCNLTADQPA